MARSILTRSALLLALLAAALATPVRAEDTGPFTWRTDELPKLPVALSHAEACVAGDTLIVGGTAERTVWANGTNVSEHWAAFALQKGAREWLPIDFLPPTLATFASDGSGAYVFGTSMVFGGESSQPQSAQRIQFTDGHLQITSLPPLPDKTLVTGAVYKGVLYAFAVPFTPPQTLGTGLLYTLNLAREGATWSTVNQMPGSHQLASLVPTAHGLYFFSGDATGAYRYTPQNGWVSIPAPKSLGTMFGYGPSYVIGITPDTIETYDVITDTWSSQALSGLRLNSDIVLWNGHIVQAGGQVDGKAQDTILTGTPRVRTNAFGFLDYLVLFAYFAAVIGMGVYFSRREKSTEAFFLGNRRVPWWAVGISIFGASVSSITFLAIPAKAYATDWLFLPGNLALLLIVPLITRLYIPAFRRLSVTTAYEYLENRFNLAIRIYGSLIFVLFQLGRMAIVLYLPALVLSAATGLDMNASILTMGVITTLYTVIGGVEAVIWNDVIQAIVLLGGALLALGIAIAHIDGGYDGLAAMAAAEGKTHWLLFTDDYTTPAIWVVVLGNAFAMFYPTTACQTIVQRYLSTATVQQARRAVWVNALLTIPVSFLFFGMGTALWGYFKQHPEQLDPTLPTDAILPVFVMETFPIGVRAILVAGVFAAAMSALSASMNSLAAVAVFDYYKRFVPALPEARALRASKWLTLVVGIVGTGLALTVAWMNAPSLFDQWLKWLNLIGGGLSGIVALGVFTRRAHGRGAVFGALVSAVAVAWVQTTPAHFLLHSIVGFLTAYVVGYVSSWIIPRARD